MVLSKSLFHKKLVTWQLPEYPAQCEAFSIVLRWREEFLPDDIPGSCQRNEQLIINKATFTYNITMRVKLQLNNTNMMIMMMVMMMMMMMMMMTMMMMILRVHWTSRGSTYQVKRIWNKTKWTEHYWSAEHWVRQFSQCLTSTRSM